MKYRIKALALVSAAVLSLALMGGAALANGPTVATVQLESGQPSYNASVAANSSFGTYQWNGTAWQQQTPAGTLFVGVNATSGAPGDGTFCDVSIVAGSDFIAGGGASIASSAVTLTPATSTPTLNTVPGIPLSPGTPANLAGNSNGGAPTGNYSWNVSIAQSALTTALNAGNYESTLTITSGVHS